MPGEPISEAHRMCVDLYLTRQEAGPEDNQLPCLFCHRGHGVDWDTTINLGTGTTITTGVCESCRTLLKPKAPPPDPDGFVHVDDFIDNYREPAYARFVLDYFRRSAVNLNAFWPFMQNHKLFCTYKDTHGRGNAAGRYRVTGASRLGDIWLSKDYGREIGYELRVNVADCHEWSGQP